jgi:diguanylate cyclase (GGDEF)-like protein
MPSPFAAERLSQVLMKPAKPNTLPRAGPSVWGSPFVAGGVVAIALACAGTSLLAGHVVLVPGTGSRPGLALTFLLVLGLTWLPASAWVLGRLDGKTAEPEPAEFQTQNQLETFRASRRDPLTGLQSRAVFLDTLAISLGKGGQLGVLLIDIDRFTEVNSLHGEGTGDEVLRVLADRLRTLAGHREFAARLDGNEFALLFHRPEDVRDIEQSAMLVLRRLSEPYAASGQLLELSVSIGIATAPVHGVTTELVLRAARLALQQAKESGGATWRVCGLDLAEQLRLRDRFREEISSAIESGQIIPYYQPIVRLPVGDIAKFEVLARWNHPTLGLLTPDRFIPLADELGLSGQITMSLLRQVALDSTNIPDWCRFAVNVSAAQVRELISFVSNQPGDWQRRMDLSRLDVEITETALLRDRDMARALIDVLHEHGARAGLDNFGSGYSNFAYLRDMPFDSIKIGKGFIQSLLDDPRAEACVMAMLRLGHGLGVDMVADGVETEDVAARLAEMGCHFAQGFLYARPAKAEEALKMLSLPNLVLERRAAAPL